MGPSLRVARKIAPCVVAGLAKGMTIACVPRLAWRDFAQQRGSRTNREQTLEALLDYAAVILAFMGAIHWGLAMRAEQQETAARLQLGLSVIPPLLGWLAIAGNLPYGLALPLLLLCFGALYLADLRAVSLGLAPRWYPALRWPLTLIVCGSLLLAWGSVLLG
ncbi:DUF3429 domain-containing protein [Aquipseudomonas campi]|uniref:DUF3429 domain-containing protein n=2 Tax=Aquipseudomonas campi TaxID=2731681 RepID=A0A6M8FPC5_9GAMM|nr:DUF3429 domain-containing protein [Pseudomonas campi]